MACTWSRLLVLLGLCMVGLLLMWRMSTPEQEMRVEYLAILPNGQGPMKESGPYTTNWVKVTYPAKHKFSAADVQMTELPANEGEDLVGGWRNVDLGSSGAMLTGTVFKGNMFVLINTGLAPVARGCCADSLRIIPQNGGGYRDIMIIKRVKAIAESLTGARFYGISHAVHPIDIGGSTHLFVPILYYDDQLDGHMTDGIIALDVNTLDFKPTADGAPMFSSYRSFGTTVTSPKDSVFKVQYIKMKGDGQQWHLNCITRFVASDGTAVLGLAQRMDVEAVLVKDPWVYTTAQGGGKILQRFGSPHIFDESSKVVGRHDFGVNHEDFLPIVPGVWLDNGIHTKANGGIHNLYHYKHADGRETMTIFCNQLNSGNRSGVFEFDLKLVHDHSVRPTDTVFKTNYTLVPLPYSTMSQGGARPIGEGVYVVASGIADQGYSSVDASGGITFYNYSYKLLYDPFVFLTVNQPPVSRLAVMKTNISMASRGVILPLCLGLCLSLGICLARQGRLRQQTDEGETPYIVL